MASDELADDFEVFVNFRGRDTRLGLVNVLRSRLKAAAIRFFYDDKSIPKGEEIDAKILGSIDRSHVYVVMLSENYAESKWCLLELARMVSQKESNGAKVILPCFCGVTVENVKLKEGSSYKEQLQNLVESKLQQIKASDKEERDKKKEEQEALNQKKEWEAALKKVTRYKGLHLNTGFDDFCKKITEAVQLTLKERHLSIEPVGTSIDAYTLEEMLDIGSGDVKFLVIHGKRGTGKTTLARTVFQRISTRFEGSSFISDVKTHNRSEDRLKRKMLRDICGDESKDIKRNFRDKRVLIVLDDVDNYEQIKELAGSSTWFGPGSRIIITSTERGVLSSHEKSSRKDTSSPPTNLLSFKVEKKYPGPALELFSRYAFWQNSPLDSLRDLSKRMVTICEGLPLLLQIMGSFLRRERCHKGWKDIIAQLEECTSVEEKLAIIYNKLEDHEKYIFLDVACFFVNEEKTNPSYMWQDAEALDRLLRLSLVKIVDGNKLWMSHCLRELGKEIVTRAERPCRYWDYDRALQVLKAIRGNEKVTGLFFPKKGDQYIDLSVAHFVNKTRLTFLKCYYVRFGDHDFERTLANLRWLSWYYCPQDFKGKNLGLSNLAILDLAQGYIKDDWCVWQQLQDNNLKVIDLTSCREITKTPGFSNFENLERLILEDCAKLAEIDSSIGDLKHLKCLNLKGCDSLKGLPDQVCSVKTLTEILISKKEKGIFNFSLPDQIGSLESLTVLAIVNVKIGRLPTSVEGLKKLQRLSLLGCSDIQKLPESIGKLQSLAELQISGTTISTLPDSIGDLKELKVIKMEHSSITSLPGAITQLRKLEELHASDSEDLKGDVPGGIEKLSQLKILDLSYTSIGELPETFGQLPNLHNLQLQSCQALRNLRMLPQTLTDLGITVPVACEVKNLLEGLTKLEKLELHVQKDTKNVVPEWKFPDGLKLPTNLSELILEKMEVHTRFLYLKNLFCLELQDCDLRNNNAEQTTGDSESVNLFPESLRVLFIYQCKCPRAVAFSGLKDLKQLEISECEGLVELEGLEVLESLEEIIIQVCASLEKIKGEIPKPERLTDYCIKHNDELNEIEGRESVSKYKDEMKRYEVWGKSLPREEPPERRGRSRKNEIKSFLDFY